MDSTHQKACVHGFETCPGLAKRSEPRYSIVEATMREKLSAHGEAADLVLLEESTDSAQAVWAVALRPRRRRRSSMLVWAPYAVERCAEKNEAAAAARLGMCC